MHENVLFNHENHLLKLEYDLFMHENVLYNHENILFKYEILLFKHENSLVNLILLLDLFFVPFPHLKTVIQCRRVISECGRIISK